MARKAGQPQLTIAVVDRGGGSIAPQYNVNWKPVFCSGYEVDEEGVKKFHHLENKACKCKPGPHWRALKAVARGRVDELALVGGRGSGKSENSFAIMIAGDVYSKDTVYVANKFYRGLVLRENAKDLDDWVSRASEI